MRHLRVRKMGASSTPEARNVSITVGAVITDVGTTDDDPSTLVAPETKPFHLMMTLWNNAP